MIETIDDRNIKYELKNYNGGFFTYIKLVKNYYLMLFKHFPLLFKSYDKLLAFFGEQSSWLNKLFPRLSYIWLIIVSIIKTPYWLLIKPFGFLFHSHTKYDGDFRMINYKVTESDVKKIKTFYFLRVIPYWFYYTTNLKEKDWNYILKKN